MTVISHKIDEAQKEYDTQIEAMDNSYAEEIKQLGIHLEADKEALEDNIVNGILSKIL